MSEKKSKNSTLTNAKKAKNDEFYTQYIDIEKEVNAYLEYAPDVFRGKTILLPCDDPEWSNFTKFFAQNFEKLGIKKLISTSYAQESKNFKSTYQPTLFEMDSPIYDEEKTTRLGKIFTLTKDTTGNGKVDIEDLEWRYLQGDGDFRSSEIQALRDEADIIITNPPFSLFREFLAWIVNAQKQFLIIGNLNALTHKDIFPLIKTNKIWLGPSISSGDREFEVPESIIDMEKFTGEIRAGRYYQRVVAIRWYTNLDHGRRHEKIPLMSMEDNLKYSKHKEVKGKQKYDIYDNYNAIEVPYVDAVPSDYTSIMGVPISVMDKYSPEQFEIVGCTYSYGRPAEWDVSTNMSSTVHGENIYKRIFIKHKQ